MRLVVRSCEVLHHVALSCVGSDEELEDASVQRPALQYVWRYLHGRKISVTRSHDDRDPGVSDVTPDFRVRVAGKREDGRPQGWRESDVTILQTANLTETAIKAEEESQRSVGITDDLRATEGTKNPEPSEETLNNHHVPGGVWLNKLKTMDIVLNGINDCIEHAKRDYK
ncbi:hypothetical protein NDU88_002225 [Pleurodeles waltl]|uniref:Uncharacterized protein n=1 Tax=Pleurodeles waltl TaxID=8319 RepID=A0AAV7W2N4_PLEWA|nr:hypothetical protein NDU88_002225 [Pleurodeles waltl]